jgi:hypothetical protein
MSFDLQPINLPLALGFWALSFLGFAIIAGIVSILSSMFVYGARGPGKFVHGIFTGIENVISLSPRRLWALTTLTFKEAIRRKALLVFVVFAVLFMFAGWFLTGTEQQKDFQAKVYISFALRTITWLLLPVVLLLSCWGIPEDIKQRSLHTVVTKPARRLEVVLGRMIGFGLIGTIILAVMGAVGYIWIVRQIPPSQRGQLICRQPVYGQLKFLDREGVPQEKGVNVGDLSEFRSYIEGATKARAIYTFENVDQSLLHPQNKCFQLESRFEAFRTHKGDMKRTTYFQYTLVNPDDPNVTVPLSLLKIDEFRNNTNFVTVGPAIQLADAEGKPLSSAAPSTEAQRDFFKDVVSKDKKLIIQVSCIDPGQYVGMSRVDLFFRKPDRPFWMGYVKTLVGIEFLLLLVVILGVTASTFVKGPVATVLTFCLIMVGMFGQDFMNQIILPPEYGGAQGGGVFESIYRIVTHMNPSTELPEGPAFRIMQWVDWILELFVWSIRYYIPNCEHFSHVSEYVANGFDVQWMESLLPSILVTVGFFLPCLFIGYYSLQSRELEAK